MRALDDFAVDHLDAEARKVADVILSVARESNDDASGGGCQAFFTRQEWADRGEGYGTHSDVVLVVVYDGGDLVPFFNSDVMCWQMREKMREALEAAGYWSEECTCWYSSIQKL